MRITSGSHFLTDVLAGAAIGSLYGWLIPWLHLRNNNERFTIVPLTNGIMVSLKF
jgi:membrane-associated phospholipid phosphatase